MTNRWISNNFVLLVSLWSDLPKDLKNHLSQYTEPLIEALRSVPRDQFPQTIPDHLGSILQKSTKDSNLERSVIFGLCLPDGRLSSADLRFPVLQIFSSMLFSDASFPRLLALLSPNLADCDLHFDPYDLCKRTELERIKTLLEKNLLIISNLGSLTRLSRAFLVNLTRLAHWFAVIGLIDNQSGCFFVAMEFLLHIYCSNCRTAKIGAQFMTYSLFNTLRSSFAQLRDSVDLPVCQIYEGNLQEISATSDHLACILMEAELVTVSHVLFKDFFVYYAFQSDVSSDRFGELLGLVYPEQDYNLSKEWVKFWLVNDSNGTPFSESSV